MNKRYKKDGNKTPLYTKWNNILQRCNNKKNPRYKGYGGRGIKCEWNSFDEFCEDMEKSFKYHVKKYGLKETTIGRIDNDGNYCKRNCRWEVWDQQFKNRRHSFHKKFPIGNDWLTADEVKDKYLLKENRFIVRGRLYGGWSLKELINPKVRKIKQELKKTNMRKFKIDHNLDISKLTKRELDILELKTEGLTLENIGTGYGLTRERVRQILANVWEILEVRLDKK